jgi:hypothetical protein
VETGFPSGKTRSVCPEIMLNSKGSDGSSLETRLATMRRHGEDVASRKTERRPIQKARDRFPGAGAILAMLNICR